MTENPAPTVSLGQVTKIYKSGTGDVEALLPIDLQVAKGEFVSLLGPSGCGKSTLLNIIAGLLPATQGRVQVLGHDVRGPVTDLGIVFQDDLLLPWRNVLKNVLLQIEVRRLPITDYQDKAEQLIKEVGLGGFEKHFPRELSGGMRQRVAICRSLIHDPPLLLMDEPFGALDAMTRDQMNVDLQAINLHEQKTVVFVTHSIAEAVFLSDRVAVISPRPGQIVEIIDIEIPRPRPLSAKEDQAFLDIISHIRELIKGMGLLRDTEVTLE